MKASMPIQIIKPRIFRIPCCFGENPQMSLMNECEVFSRHMQSNKPDDAIRWRGFRTAVNAVTDHRTLFHADRQDLQWTMGGIILGALELWGTAKLAESISSWWTFVNNVFQQCWHGTGYVVVSLWIAILHRVSSSLTLIANWNCCWRWEFTGLLSWVDRQYNLLLSVLIFCIIRIEEDESFWYLVLLCRNSFPFVRYSSNCDGWWLLCFCLLLIEIHITI